MFRQFTYHASRCIVALLALLIFNFSIAYNKGVRFEDTDSPAIGLVFNAAPVNEIESVFELVTEEWLDIEDCVPETSDDDTPEDSSPAKNIHWDVCYAPFNILTIVITITRPEVHGAEIVFYSRHTPPTPPPDVV